MSKAKTRLGNWQEEIAFEEDKKKLQKALQSTGGLLSQQILAKVQQHTVPCALGQLGSSLQYGVPFLLQNSSNDGTLAIDMDDRILGPLGWKVNCSTTPSRDATLRNSWIVMPSAASGAALGDSVCYGSKVLICSVAELADPPVFLASEMKTPQSCSKFSKNQEVYFTPNTGIGSLWSFEYSNPEYRQDVEGQPINPTSAVVLKHVATNNFLAVTNFHFTNDFGSENEICCARLQTFASKSRSAPERSENYWKIVGAL
jgi:hypothetical protein